MPEDSLMSPAVQKDMVLLDTNALTAPFVFHIDIQNEIRRLLGNIRVVVPYAVITELQELKEKEPNAKTALEYAGRFETIETPRTGDEAVLRCALENNAYVFTNDRALIRRLKDNKVPVLLVRKKQTVVIEYP